ncbi:mediator-associated protein 2 [Striga asiatica]|uniref:Mediator-associated protein 2 n=1 Tax=Striga asiatica TaxID=4170 RepID=A0A5A7Q529_STRAF|nr:mediator-associated protein 2 [Striga asiatica]
MGLTIATNKLNGPSELFDNFSALSLVICSVRSSVLPITVEFSQIHMDVAAETLYKPPAGFVEDKRDPLVDLELTESTELWLIQWPINQPLDFDGQTVSLKLGRDGHLGTLEGSSGKSYEMVGCKTNGPEANVFLTSTAEAKIAGKISRRISLIHYPEPGELLKRNSLSMGLSQRSSGATSTLSGWRLPTPSRSIRPTKSKISGLSTPSSRSKSSGSGLGESSKPAKRKRADEQSKPTSNLAQDSGRGNSGVTSAGSVEQHSQVRKSKKKKENED